MKVTLPVQLNPISRRKDKSVKLSFETRELTPTETMTLMEMESEEGWIVFSSNQDIRDGDIPDQNAELGEKTLSQRIRNALYKYYMQRVEKQETLGSFQSFYDNYQEKQLQTIKDKLI